jgi:uncharacterized hydrophobic protein (TIGR00271 family)
VANFFNINNPDIILGVVAEIKFFANLKESEKKMAIEKLVQASSPSQQFFFMVVLSVLMATFGILQNSAPVIIGSMLIAPVLYPVLGLSMGLVMSDSPLVSRSLLTLLKSFVYALLASFIASILFSSAPSIIEISIDFIKPSLSSAAVAVVAGLAASFSLAKEEISETLPGVAISVSLVPPLAAIGVGISILNLSIIINAFLLFMVNVIGIVFASMLIFSLMDFYKTKHVVAEEIKKDKVEIEKDAIVESE